MAKAKAEVSSITFDITKCSICLETFKDPKVLPCIHTFCLQCLHIYCSAKEKEHTQNMMSCPLCEKVFTLPPGGVQNLPNNSFIHQLLQVNQPTVTTEGPASMKPTSFNQVEPKYEMLNSAERVKSENDCEQHPWVLNRLYCYDCKMIMCPMCVSTHQQHVMSDVSESADIFKEQLKDDTVKVSACANKKRKEIDQLVIDKNRFIERVASTESEISQKYDDLILLIQLHKSKLMEELHEFKENQLKQIETKKYEIECQWMIMESYNVYCLDIISNGASSDACRAAHDLHTKAEELVMIREESDDNKMNKVEIKFNPSLLIADSVRNVIGELNYTVEVESGLNASSFMDNPHLLGVTPAEGGYIRGLTVLDSELFVVRQGSTHCQVDVYDTKSLTLTRNIPITGSSSLEAIVASPRRNCLFISDPGLKIVYRYNLSDNVCSSWSVDGECYGLSLTITHNVLVSLSTAKQIKEYTPDGSLVREISLDSSMEGPWHSVQLSSDQFVVSHGNYGAIHRVCIVDTSGRIIRCYGGSQGSGVGQLNVPTNLALDRHGNILVADLSNNRVVLLSPSLTHQFYVTIPGHTLNRPWALHLDLLTRRLYIGEVTDPGRVLVLTV